MVDGPEVRGHHLLADGPCLTADVEVIAVQAAERLVEAELPGRPGGEDHDEAVDGIDLAGLGEGRLLAPDEGHRGEVASAKLLVLVAEGRPPHGTLPPGDAPDADGTRTTHDGDVRIGERLADRAAEVLVEQLGILMDENHRLEVLVLAGLVEDQVVVAKHRAGGLMLQDLGIGLTGTADPRGRVLVVDIGVGDRGGEGDHLCRPRRSLALSRFDSLPADSAFIAATRSWRSLTSASSWISRSVGTWVSTSTSSERAAPVERASRLVLLIALALI